MLYVLTSVFLLAFRGAHSMAGEVSEPAGSNIGSASKHVRISERKCEEYVSNATQTVTIIPLIPGADEISISLTKCEVSSNLFPGEDVAFPGEFPHMASIGWVDLEDNYVFQSGSLISSRFVLTTAHNMHAPSSLLKDPKPKIVRFGDQNLIPTIVDGPNQVDVPIKSIHKHPGYKAPKIYNDIALIELTSDVDFGSYIRPACLWSKPDFPGYTRALVTGWGVLQNSKSDTASLELKKSSLKLLDNFECNVTMKGAHNRLWQGTSDGQLCASELHERNICQGYSGSPLQVASHDNQCIFHVIGLTSFRRGCGAAASPVLFTRVSSYLDWIESIVWPGED